MGEAQGYIMFQGYLLLILPILSFQSQCPSVGTRCYDNADCTACTSYLDGPCLCSEWRHEELGCTPLSCGSQGYCVNAQYSSCPIVASDYAPGSVTSIRSKRRCPCGSCKNGCCRGC